MTAERGKRYRFDRFVIEHCAGLKRASAHLQALLEGAPCKPEEIERWRREGEAFDEAAIAMTCLREDETR